MSEKITVVALGHRALGTTLPEQKIATKKAAKAIADLVEAGNRVVISHSNGPQVGMIHTAMNEFGKAHPDYTFAPMSVCSAMSQGYIGYDLQTAIRAELLSRGIYKPVATVLTQVVIDPYDDAFAEPEKIIGRVLTKEEAEAEEHKGNFVTELADGTYKRILAAPKPQKIVELETIRTLVDRHCSRRRRYPCYGAGCFLKRCQCYYRERPDKRTSGSGVKCRYSADPDQCREGKPES